MNAICVELETGDGSRLGSVKHNKHNCSNGGSLSGKS